MGGELLNLAFIDNNSETSSNDEIRSFNNSESSTNETTNSDFFDNHSDPSNNEIINSGNNGGQGLEHGFLTRIQIYFTRMQRRRELRRNAEAINFNCFSIGGNSEDQDDERIIVEEEEVRN